MSAGGTLYQAWKSGLVAVPTPGVDPVCILCLQFRRVAHRPQKACR